MMKPLLFIAISVVLQFAACQKEAAPGVGADGVVACLPPFGSATVVPPADAELILMEQQGPEYLWYRLKPRPTGSGAVSCDASGVDRWNMLSPERTFGAYYSDIGHPADGKVTFTMPEVQRQTVSDPSSGRHMCLLADRMENRGGGDADIPGMSSAKLVIGFRSLASVLRIPVVNIPSGERLSSVAVKACDGERPFVKTLSLPVVNPFGNIPSGLDVDTEDCTDAMTVEVEASTVGSDAVVSLSILPAYLLECLLSGTTPDVRTLLFDVTFTTLNASGQKVEYLFSDRPMEVSKWSMNGSYAFYNEGKPFDLTADASRLAMVDVTGETLQLLRFGVDAERLWYYWPKQRERLAEMAVKELKADYVRVAINCGYEREEGVLNPDAYTEDIVPLMNHLRKYNPQVKFFATTRPLKEAYDVDKNPEDAAFVNQNFKNGNITMYSYPIWVGGNKNVLIDRYRTFDRDKMVRYLSDYLNLMDEYGFDIEYMDLTNEDQDVWEADIDNILYVVKEIPGHLNPGVRMPRIVFPSTWSPGDGFTKFLDLDKVKGNERAVFEALDVISTHNTPDTDASNFDNASLVRFAETVHAVDPDKELWNTEMHGWVGSQDPAADIRNSEIFWQHIRAGFTGIDTWLFFGPWSGADHSMVYSNNNNSPVTTAKYEIFKTVVNEMNLGRHIGSESNVGTLTPVVMLKENRMMVCLHNRSDRDCHVRIELPQEMPVQSEIGTVRWEEALKNVSGVRSEAFSAETPTSFTLDVPMQAVVCCTFDVGKP